jgi:GAF domain-containing protein
LFAEMALDLHQHRDSPERTLEAIVEWTQWATDCSGAGIMLVGPDDSVLTPVSTAEAINKAHDLQIEFGEGPCLEVITAVSDHYLTQDAASDPDYPQWGPAVAELGFSSIISVVLGTDEHRYGSLNLYAEQKNAFGPDDLALAEIFARHAAVALASAHEGHKLKAELDARKLIGQAQGILMERFNLDADRAFDLLRQHAQARDVGLRAVSDWIVQNRSNPDS